MRHALLILSLFCLGLTACARQPEKLQAIAISPQAEADPWEQTNRKIYEFNERVDRYMLSPVTHGYRTVVPKEPRRGISNFYSLAREPSHFVNAVLQAKPRSAFRALQRLVVNGVLGLGVADHATDMGLAREPHDFGQTLAVWGVPSGPYFYAPLLGPNTVRDAFGFLVDFIFDPADIPRNEVMSIWERHGMLAGRVMDFRSDLMDQGDQLLVGAVDPYATMRTAWLQLRRYQILDGDVPLDDDYDDDDYYDSYDDLDQDDELNAGDGAVSEDQTGGMTDAAEQDEAQP